MNNSLFFKIEGLETGEYFVHNLNRLYQQVNDFLGTPSKRYLQSVVVNNGTYASIAQGTAKEVWNTMLDLAKEK